MLITFKDKEKGGANMSRTPPIGRSRSVLARLSGFASVCIRLLNRFRNQGGADDYIFQSQLQFTQSVQFDTLPLRSSVTDDPSSSVG